ncbi:MAG: glycosyltransferase family 39 protein, partial [Myxococcales bacterium]|nr:glycosyltransferase family 39 protein [Myxococcales bacterium]
MILFAVALVAGSLGLRLVHHAHTEVNRPLRADAGGYFMTAANLYRFGVYSRDKAPAPDVAPRTRTTLPPGYPLLLSTMIESARDQKDFLDSVVFLQALLGSILPLLVFALARCGLPFLPSAAAAIASALSPHLIALEAFVLTEAIFSFLLTLSVLLFVRARESGSIALPVAAGLALGLTHLVREVALPLPFLFAALLLLDRRKAAPDTRRRI